MVFAGQSGVYRQPLVMWTYAPATSTPVVKECLIHDKLSEMSGSTPEEQMYMTVQE